MNRWLKAMPYALTLLVWCYVPFMVYGERHHSDGWGRIFDFVYGAVLLIFVFHIWRIVKEPNKLLYIVYMVGNFIVLPIGWYVVFLLSGGTPDM